MVSNCSLWYPSSPCVWQAPTWSGACPARPGLLRPSSLHSDPTHGPFLLPYPQARPSLLLCTCGPSVRNALSLLLPLSSPPSLYFKYHTNHIRLIWAACNPKQNQTLARVIDSGGLYHIESDVRQQPPELSRAVVCFLGKAERTVARLKKHFHLESLLSTG